MIISVTPWLEIGRLTVGRAGNSRGRSAGSAAGVMLSADPFAPLGSMDGGDRAPSRSSSDERSSGDAIEGDYHLSVLLDEAVNGLKPAPGKTFFDGTLGAGGHSEAILKAGASVIACDQDLEAIAHAVARLQGFGDRFSAVHGNFASMDAILNVAGCPLVDGIVLDLGASSRHFDAAERGFSFQKDGPLDMRMNQRGSLSAADLVNEADEVELARIFWEYGEERASRRIARAIVEARARGRIERTLQLADLVATVLPRGGAKHPATRTFQALRIAVNDELARLEEALRKSADCLKVGGVLAIISFHSLEDRIVKQFLRRHSDKFIDRPEWPAAKPNPDYLFDLPMRKPVAPSVSELKANPRSRSAKLRLAVRR